MLLQPIFWINDIDAFISALPQPAVSVLGYCSRSYCTDLILRGFTGIYYVQPIAGANPHLALIINLHTLHKGAVQAGYRIYITNKPFLRIENAYPIACA